MEEKRILLNRAKYWSIPSGVSLRYKFPLVLHISSTFRVYADFVSRAEEEMTGHLKSATGHKENNRDWDIR